MTSDIRKCEGVGDVHWNIVLFLIGIILQRSYGYEGGAKLDQCIRRLRTMGKV